jgi:hypothetical protein
MKTGADLGAAEPHVHLEAIGQNGSKILENSHVYLK